MSASPVRYDVRGTIARVTLTRPEVRNALGLDTVQELARATDRARDDRSVRLMVLQAEGPAFCAGMDLKSIDLGDPKQTRAFTRGLALVYERLLTLEKPVLCAVEGPVSGGGVGLPAASDLVWAGRGARFTLPETRLGIVPALVSVPLRHRVGSRALVRLALAGLSLDPEQAVAQGLADFSPAGPAEAAADAFAETLIRDHAPGALIRTKRFLTRQAVASLRDELDAASAEFEAAVDTQEARRGLDAFRRKESVRWDE